MYGFNHETCLSFRLQILNFSEIIFFFWKICGIDFNIYGVFFDRNVL